MSQIGVEQLQYRLRFFHPEKCFSFLPGSKNLQVIAQLFGISFTDYKKIKRSFVDNVTQAAQQLLDETDYRQHLQQLPFRTGHVLSVIGDSLTSDDQSWLNIFYSSWQQLQPQQTITLYNDAMSGETSTQALGSLVSTMKRRPHYLFCLTGTNDARRQAGKINTGLAEVENNFAALAAYATKYSQAQWIWITPGQVDEQRIQQDMLLQQFSTTWSNQHLQQINTLILDRSEPVINLHQLFVKDLESLLEKDGLHWSLLGQMCVAREIVKQLVHLF